MVNQSDAFYILLLIGMWFVTLVPRIAPPFFWRADKVPPKLSFALALIPFAVLGALIVRICQHGRDAVARHDGIIAGRDRARVLPREFSLDRAGKHFDALRSERIDRRVSKENKKNGRECPFFLFTLFSHEDLSTTTGRLSRSRQIDLKAANAAVNLAGYATGAPRPYRPQIPELTP